MPLKDGSLTPREAAFAGYMAATGDATYSAAKAGYPSPQVAGWQKANNPAMMETVRKAQAARMTNELLPKSLDLLEKLISDDKRADRVRLAAAQTVLKYSLGAADGAEEKEAHEMTPAQLQARIETLRRTLADKARPVIEGEAIEAIEVKGDVFG